ncbi:hypothetical protein O1L68_41745 [Streptomyces lydicus]|nr:hypothetical protein [Streptomyces lydicus]
MLYSCLHGGTRAEVLGCLDDLTRRRLQLTPFKSYADAHNRGRFPGRDQWWYVEQLLKVRTTVHHLVVPSLEQVAHRVGDQRALARWCAKMRVELHFAAPAEHGFTFEELADDTLDVLVDLEKAHQFAYSRTTAEDISAAIIAIKEHLHEHIYRARQRREAMCGRSCSGDADALSQRIRRAERVLEGPDATYAKRHLELLASALHGLLPEEWLRRWNDPWAAARRRAG